MHLAASFLALLPLLTSMALAAIYNDPSQLPMNKQYDFVVIGAGNAGAVVAARLGENPKFKVLVIEAGRYNEGFQDELITIPFFGPTASPQTSFDWNYTTVPQPFLANQNIPFPRGYVLGGSSSTNYMVFTRGAKDDYDNLAKVAGTSDWSWNNLWPYAIKNEKHTRPADGHDDSKQYISSYHGTKGPLLTSVAGYSTELDPRVLALTQELDEFPFNPDNNGGHPLGISWMHSTIGGGVRSSSATAFLLPALRSHSNIDLLYNAQVTKLIQTGRAGNVPVFHGVEFARSSRARRYTVTVKNEIVLAAGAFGTPQILLLSGIGPAKDLRDVGVVPIVDLPEVGQNLVDHPLLPVQWRVNSTGDGTLDPIVRGEAAFDESFEEYNTHHTGRFANGLHNFMGFFRIPKGHKIIRTHGDPSTGPTAPHIELAPANGFFTTSQPIPESGAYFTLINVVVSPTSKGYVKLASKDPFAHPIIDPKLLDTQYDRDALIYSIRAAQRWAGSEAFKDYVIGPYTPLETDAQILEYASHWATTIKHPFCTARVDKRPGKGVVDGKLLVKNVHGIRIVDASIWPLIPASHPMAAVYIVAERIADVIKATYG